jgi:tetratricopeptide (TPR) repeat protein
MYIQRILWLVFLFCFPIVAQSQRGCIKNEVHPMPVLSEQSRLRMQGELTDALRALQAVPAGLEELIWVGRRTAYLGQYHQANDYFSQAIARHPLSAAPYRHRGHRYITLRCFDQAITDFERAAALTKNQPDEVEPDGMPNEQNIPTSTLQSNIWYHLGLAHYLKGDFDKAVESYKVCLSVSRNPDMYMATANWYYLALLRSGKKAAAANFLASIDTSVTLIENHVYMRLIKLHQAGHVPADPLVFLQQEAGLEGVTYAYGLGAFLLTRGEKEKARQVFRHIVQFQQWGSFGYIAAEIELAR